MDLPPALVCLLRAETFRSECSREPCSPVFGKVLKAPSPSVLGYPGVGCRGSESLWAAYESSDDGGVVEGAVGGHMGLPLWLPVSLRFLDPHHWDVKDLQAYQTEMPQSGPQEPRRATLSQISLSRVHARWGAGCVHVPWACSGFGDPALCFQMTVNLSA